MVEITNYQDGQDGVIHGSKYTQYGAWTKTEGKLEDMSQGLLDDIKSLMYEVAEESLKEVGIDLKDHQVEWVIKNNYTNGKRFDDNYFPDSDVHVTIAWKIKVKNNG